MIPIHIVPIIIKSERVLWNILPINWPFRKLFSNLLKFKSNPDIFCQFPRKSVTFFLHIWRHLRQNKKVIPSMLAILVHSSSIRERETAFALGEREMLKWKYFSQIFCRSRTSTPRQSLLWAYSGLERSIECIERCENTFLIRDFRVETSVWGEETPPELRGLLNN